MLKILAFFISLSILLLGCASLRPIEYSDLSGVYSYKSLEIFEVLKLNEDRTYRYYSYYREDSTTKKDSCIGTFSINKKQILLKQKDSLSSSCKWLISPYVLGPDAANLEI